MLFLTVYDPISPTIPPRYAPCLPYFLIFCHESPNVPFYALLLTSLPIPSYDPPTSPFWLTKAPLQTSANLSIAQPHFNKSLIFPTILLRFIIPPSPKNRWNSWLFTSQRQYMDSTLISISLIPELVIFSMACKISIAPFCVIGLPQSWNVVKKFSHEEYDQSSRSVLSCDQQCFKISAILADILAQPFTQNELFSHTSSFVQFPIFFANMQNFW